MPSIPIPFEVGATLWWCGAAPTSETIQCPDCAGKRQHLVILGNGEEVYLDCATCGHCRDSTGYIDRTVYKFMPELYTTIDVDIHGKDVYYKSVDNNVNAKALFATEAECAVDCGRRQKQSEANSEEQIIRNIKSKRRGLAWSVHYWARQIKDREREVVAAKKRYRISKEKKRAKDA